jgi:flagellar basal-body rod protein FlgB
VSEITDSALIAALRRQMTVAAAKQVASAGNLANIDTPGYRAKEASFDDALSKHMPVVRTSDGRQKDLADLEKPVIREIQGLPARRDGNTVQLDRELLTMGKAAGDFAAAQTALAAKFRLVRYAINEGR